MRIVNGQMRIPRAAAMIFFLAMQTLAFAQQNSNPSAQTQTPAPQDPVLVPRPAPKAEARRTRMPEGAIKLDVVVDDAAGKPAGGLNPLDLQLMDNGQPRKILSFRAFGGDAAKPDSPVQVVLVIDTVNLPFDQVAFTKQEITRFLRQNGGHLSQPVSIALLTDAGLRVQPRPSTDGNALVGIVDRIKGSIRSINAAMGGEGLLERFQLSVHQMANIAENEAMKPGRKLLIWVGPGWPMLNRTELGYYSAKDRQRYFDGIVELSTKLREARMAVYSVASSSVGAGGSDSTFVFAYKDYLKPVKSPQQGDSGNLALKVIAVQSGGRILGPDNDLAGEIGNCIQDANDFYRISFDPPHADHANEYHDLKVVVGKPGVTVRTNTGYYNQPQAETVPAR